ncbi:flavin reductase family protein [Robiginitalea sp. IMCC44478]|uniref:flavin reductase family protein n=1 Tax=Robiginitalea sp. IMCC44478 TaxID=3459122 RepID=UPI0040413EDF
MEERLSLNPSDLETRELHAYLLGAVGPRPIAFASTIGTDGQPNLAPFSFFNVFSANPPVLIFSPARRVRDNTTKHTLENVQQNKEVVINVVSYDMVQQMSLASTEYGKGVNEFKKAGFTMLPSEKIKPFRVAESPVQFECRVTKVMALGKEGGAGNLIFSEVVKMHISRSILDQDGRIDPFKLDLVSRLGGNWYSRAAAGLFEVPKPLSSLGVGVDAIPLQIRQSKILSGNDLGMLGNVDSLPSAQEVQQFLQSNMEARSVLSTADTEQVHKKAKEYLEQKDVNAAWNLLLAGMQA